MGPRKVSEKSRATEKMDSPLLEELRNCRDGVHAGTDAAPDPHGAGINPGLNAVHAASALTRGSLSPVHHPSADEPTTAPSADQPAAAVQPGPPPGVASPLSRHRRSSLLFLKKVCCLAHQRLKQLCMDVHLLPGHAVQERTIWTLLEHTVRNEPDLMAGRHLDQIMMCAIYAICKVHNIDLKFKTIVTAYKGMPHAKQQTFKHVLIRENQYDSIIVFYNLVFMQQLKANILQFVSPHPPTLSPIPSAMLSPSSFRASPLRVPGRSNFYISPLKNPARSLASVPLTPKSRLLVCIGETIGSPQFQRINAVIGASGRGAKRRLVEEGGSGVGGHGGVARPQSKRLLFDCGEAGADETDGAKPHNGSGDALATNGRSRSIIHRKVSELAFAFQRTRKGDGGDSGHDDHDDHDDK